MGTTAAKRDRIGDEQSRNLDGIVADIYDEEVDINLVKIHPVSHFGNHIWRFGKIQKNSTESGERNHKTRTKEGYRQSNKNDTSHQILRIYSRLDSLKIHEMNIQADLERPIADKLHDKQRQRQIDSATRQPQGFTPTIETISQFNHSLENIPDLVHDYYRRKTSTSSMIELDTVKQFPVEICQLFLVQVENFHNA